MDKKISPATAFRWSELLFACAKVLSPYLLAWLALAVTQA